MPCYDPRDSERVITEYKTGISPDDLQTQVDRGNMYMGAFCAVMNELQRKSIAEEVLASASRSGKIDLFLLWKQHVDYDVNRLAKDIHERYSKDEQLVIRELLLKI
jgi:hypothetical protein